MLKYDYIHRFLRRNFHQFGGVVATYPYHFVFIPTAVFLVLAIGFTRLSVVSDVEYLYVPTTSRALKERDAVEKLFPPEKGRFDILRMTKPNPSGSVIIEAKDGGSIFRERIMESVKQVDEIIKNIEVIWENNTFSYSDLCSFVSDEECFINNVFYLESKMKDIIKRRTCVRYPIHSEEGSFYAEIYAFGIGGVTVDENNCIQDAKAIRLLYYLGDATTTEKELALMWEEAFLQKMSETLMDDVYVYTAISTMLDRDGSKFTKLVLPVFYVAIPVMFTFAVLTCLTSDWITSKPWIGAAAFISPIIASIGAFGFILFCGMEYPEFNISIPFLMLAIGLDDSFVLLSAWRRTDPESSVEQRMRETYAEAAVSITITSLTNLLSFCVGITTPYRVHKIFFVYAATTVIFAYIAEITFFGGALALSGQREKRNLHALFFTPVENRNKNEHTKKQKKRELSSSAEEQPRRKEELVTFYRDVLGRLLSRSWAKILVILTFLIYLSGGIYGLAYLKEGLNIRMVFPPTTYAFKFIEKNYEYFSDYPHIVQVVIHETLDYSDPLVQKDVGEILEKFATANKMAGTDIYLSWLHSYLSSTEDLRLWYSYRNYNISRKDDFMSALETVFLKLKPFQSFSKDILFNKNKTKILASRFMVISRDVMDGYEEADLIAELWKVADTCKYPVHVHNFRFVVQSLSVEVKDACIRTILASTFLAILVFVVTVPNLLCVILVGIAVASIELCVLGYMFLWNIGLDIVSSTGLIVTTGLAVDYLAHVSYAYIISQSEDFNEKMRDALHSAGHPVFQGCFSTILLVCTFPVADAYGFTVLFKIFVLLMLFAGFNSLTLLPVSLSLCETFLTHISKRDKLNRTNPMKAELESSSLMKSSKNGRTKTDGGASV